jgi:phosphoribosylformimino-5-aminoimidazole carboxamide ribotide isomerase
VKVLVAIDISNGKVVRMSRGEMRELVVYRDDPVATALEWQAQGAEWLHVVDVDAAILGEERNATIVEEILKAASVSVQLGGGIRSFELVARWLEAGATRVCVGTKALDDDFIQRVVKEFGDRVVASVDARGGEVRVEGWQQASGRSAVELSTHLEELGIARIMFTDISRDGTLEGPNIEAIRELLGSVYVPVVASGGVEGERSLEELSSLESRGLEAVVIGKAFYTGALALDRAMKVAAG